MFSRVFFFFFFLFLSRTLSLNQEGLYLQQAKLGLSDPTNSLSSWNDQDATPCGGENSGVWRGVTCNSNASGAPGEVVVVSVDLSGMDLAGPFPSSLCRLPFLSNLSLSNNYINASLSAGCFSGCESLTHLNLSENLLVGPIPESLSRLPNLRGLYLKGNNFSGEIPVSFGGFRRLEYLHLAGNLLTGAIPSSLGQVTTLKELVLAYNPFAPSRIPSQLGNLTNLEFLWLSDCHLVGPIPESFSQLGRLVNLDLSLNRLTGSIPSWINLLKNVEQIELYGNSFSGELPSKMGNMTKLRRFDASMNQLTGTIPDELTQLELESLNLFENKLEGQLPESITRSRSLQELKLFNNKLVGELPSQLGANSPLQYVDLSYNQFSGELPTNLCAKGELQDLILLYNSFSGKIPENLGNCQSLARVRLRNNRFQGRLPDDFWGLPHLYLLELLDNSFSGQISEKISGAFNLSILLISRNRFSGKIPDEIGLLNRLIHISGGQNRFSGNIPGGLVNLRQLSKLDLSRNQLSGEIPEGIQELKYLNELNLADNNLSGKIPSEIGSLSVLNYLDLSGNQLSGDIPFEMQNLKLNVLNLSNNRLSGKIPPLYAKQMYRTSFLGNPGLCNDMEGLCSRTGESKNRNYFWILLSILILAGLVLVVGVVWFVVKYREFKRSKEGLPVSKWRSFHKLGFDELDVVKNLKEENVIGAGASGKVYKVELKHGEVVAVKKLNGETRREDDSNRNEFEAEVETLGNIRHRNIVRLWCCCNSSHCKLLVYEYMPNGSLADMLVKGEVLNWPRRYKIAMDAAEGLSYLHHDCVPPIVHRDVKSSNILLDEEFGAKVADFGVAKMTQGVGEKGAGSMSMIAGSCGYIAPEYAYTLRVNEKSDVYSFGVVLLELITGKQPFDPELGDQDLVRWVFTTLDQNGLETLIDPKLGSGFEEPINKVLHIALLCTSSLPINRPTMRKVVKMLQEAVMEDHKKFKSGKREGKFSPYYNDDMSEQDGSV